MLNGSAAVLMNIECVRIKIADSWGDSAGPAFDARIALLPTVSALFRSLRGEGQAVHRPPHGFRDPL
jgi:hypothetical protein